jgi:hypothetical protein
MFRNITSTVYRVISRPAYALLKSGLQFVPRVENLVKSPCKGVVSQDGKTIKVDLSVCAVMIFNIFLCYSIDKYNHIHSFCFRTGTYLILLISNNYQNFSSEAHETLASQKENTFNKLLKT